ncbi:hypothetical protein TNCT_688761 [Trichonephila clavata]|uniref:Uncharacterized protein n=1 Tax=Trichonephila clavata TaxID=2740835 RepID=A0A8X6F5N9_TRICU|nr:hypothetical protein TNCT_688761 [Trichonephila clavata]
MIYPLEIFFLFCGIPPIGKKYFNNKNKLSVNISQCANDPHPNTVQNIIPEIGKIVLWMRTKSGVRLHQSAITEANIQVVQETTACSIGKLVQKIALQVNGGPMIRRKCLDLFSPEFKSSKSFRTYP